MKRSLPFLLLIIFVMTACVEYPYDPETAQNIPARAEPLLIDNIPPIPVIARSELEQERTYRLEEIRFPSFSVAYWQPAGAGPHPAILLLPAIWGDRYMNRFARDLVEKGFICVQLPSHRYLDRVRQLHEIELSSLAETIRQQVMETEQLLGWLSTQPSVDPNRIGILGASIGAIIASLLTESDNRIQASAYLLGGGNLSEVMAAPQGYVKKRVRQRIMSQNGMTDEEFQKEAALTLKAVDPLTYAGRLDPSRIFMVNGRFDEVIPYKNAKEFWNALGRPDWLVIPAGHYTASFFLRYIRYRVSQHFIQQL